MASTPMCPNHAVPLVDLPFPMTAKGQGTCPISSAQFDYEVDIDTEQSDTEGKVDKFGNKSTAPNYKIVSGSD